MLGFSLMAVACSSASDPVSGESASAEVDGEQDLTPAYWNVDALSDSPTPGSEPLNVILTTNLSMTELEQELRAAADAALKKCVTLATCDNETVTRQGISVWHSVPIGVGLAGCISEERATIEGEPTNKGVTAQEISWRLGGRIVGCAGVVAAGESHARGWRSPSRSRTAEDGSTIDTWYFALSQEHLCKAIVNGAAKPWHCILPQDFESGLEPPISLPHKFTAKTGGYNQGRDHFVDNLKSLDASKFDVHCESIERKVVGKNQGGAGKGLLVPVTDQFAEENFDRVEVDFRDDRSFILKRVEWDNQAAHCTVLRKTK